MTLKILYAISDRASSAIQLSRFLTVTSDKDYIVKTAGYRRSNISLDWTLDALLDMFNPSRILPENDNLEVYFEQIKSYDPDLIISDLEIFTSYVGRVLDKTVWQVSPLLLYYGTKDKYKSSAHKNYGHTFRNQFTKNERLKNVVFNSNYNFIYSHFGDTIDPPKLAKNYEWIRPYHVIGNVSRPCEHEIVAQLLMNDKKIFSILKRYKDAVAFSNFLDERYSGITIKGMGNVQEYACNVKNCNVLINQGYTDFLADAFYNGKPSLVVPDFSDSESLMNAGFSEYKHLSKTLYDNEDIVISDPFDIHYDEKIQYLHEKIDEEL
jgi:uncharacterized protein (TIGR00661 family)